MKSQPMTQHSTLSDFSDLLAITPAQAAVRVAGVAADSRVVEKDDVFVALSGSKTDGSTFARQAVQKGAGAVIAGAGAQIDIRDVPVIRVDNPRHVLAMMAARLNAPQPATIVAVTGTAGKTSVASFARQIFTHAALAAASIGTTGVDAPNFKIDGSLTTPDPVALHKMLQKLAQAGVAHVALEASSHGLDQHRLDGVVLAAGGFTNLGRDHLDYHPTVDDYFAAKMRLFTERLSAGQPAVIFADDAFSDRAIDVAQNAGLSVLTVGRKGDFIALKRVEHERHRQIAEVVHAGQTRRIELPLAGDFQIANALVAAGLAISVGVAAEQVFDALENLTGASGRLELVGSKHNGAPVYVDYAHKPEALEQVLQSVRPFTTGRVCVVFGCGGDRDPGKRAIMGDVAVRNADRVYVTDDNPRSEDPAAIRAAIMQAATGAIEIGDRRAAIVAAVNDLAKGDTLIVAGKGHETGQTTNGVTSHFSDHEEVRAALGLERS